MWVESSRGDEKSEAGKTKSHVFTAFDPQGIGHQRMTSEGGDSESVRTGWESWGINANEEPVPRRVRKKRSGRWAKVEVSYAICPAKSSLSYAIQGPRFPKGTAPTMRIPESSGRCLAASDEEEDDGVPHDISDYL